jgi:N-acetylneuraminate synthase
MRIGAREIGRDQRPYLIAEMSGNHNQSLETALEIVDAAARAGADAIKLQTYTADTMTLNVNAPGFVIDDPASLWNGRQLHDLYEEAHTPWGLASADHGARRSARPALLQLAVR